jgi:hypothetical protein
MMKADRAKTILTNRISQAHKWSLEGFPGQIKDLKLRKYPCLAFPKRFIDDPHRGGRHGVCFSLQWNGEKSQIFEAQMEIRINPDRKGGPAISYFICQDTTGINTENITWYKMNDAHVETYNLDALSIQDFFHHLIKYILKEDHCQKFFIYNQKIDQQ